jgi:hypothetical protein
LNQPKPINLDDAIDQLLEMLENSEAFTHITEALTLIIKVKVPDWRDKDFEEAATMLVIDLMPVLYPSLPFDPKSLSKDDFYALWDGLAEHLLLTVD